MTGEYNPLDGVNEPNTRLAVDFDNTLTQDNVRYWTGEHPEPDEDVIEAVNDHYKSGGTVIIWTARPWSEAGRIAGHLTEWGVRWHALRCDKGSADIYVDDKAVRPDEFVGQDDEELFDAETVEAME